MFTTVTGSLTTAAQSNITSTGTLTSLSVSGNANVGNIGTGGLITATGNITGDNVIANTSLKVGSNTAMLSNVARYTWVSNVAPSSGDGTIGDIWYQTV